MAFLKFFTIRNILVAGSIAVAGLSSTAYFYFGSQFESSLSRTTGELRLPELTNRVIILRDEKGIPFIKAENEPDLFTALGYAMAQDRLWQMEAMRLLGRGALSEVVGSAASDIDLFVRTMGLKQSAERSFALIPPELKSLMDNYAAGINAFIKNNESLSPEFILAQHQPEPWSTIDVLYISQLLNLSLASNFIEELAWLEMVRTLPPEMAAWLFPIYPDEPLPFAETAKIPAGELSKLVSGLFPENVLSNINELISPASGSNNWAIGRSRTGSGRPIMANDTHLKLTMPSSWMLVQMECPTLKVSGFSIPGIPFISIGYNGTFAWGATMVMADTQDIFVEKIRKSKTGYEYLFKEKWRPVESREEIFQIKGADPVTRTIYSTHHGPLLNEIVSFSKKTPLQAPQLTGAKYKLPDSGSEEASESDYIYGLALQSTSAWGDNSAMGFYQLSKAKNIKEFRTALRSTNGIYLNIVYADRNNIGWQVTGNYPIRKKGLGLLPSNGWSGDYEWNGQLPFEKQPHSENPASDYIVTANHRVAGGGLLGSTWRVPERFERISELLATNGKSTFSSVTQMQKEQLSLMTLKLRDKFFPGGKLHEDFNQLLISHARKEQLTAALEMWRNFDGNMKASSAPAALIGAFYHFINHRIFYDELSQGAKPDDDAGIENGESSAWNFLVALNDKSYSAWQDHLLYRPQSPFWDNINTPERENQWQIIAAALLDAYDLCSEEMGDVANWEWGKLHYYIWRHDFTRTVPFMESYFNRGPLPAGGDTFTINNAGSTWGKDFEAWFIPALRMVTDFSQEEPLFVITTHGQSGHPESSHYDDMIEQWTKGELHNLITDFGRLQANGAKKLLLLPYK